MHFPLLERYVQHNETVEGIEEALLQATIQRNRRKGRKRLELSEGAEKRMREFAQTLPVPMVPEDAGYDKAPADPVTPRAAAATPNGILPTIIPLEVSEGVSDEILAKRAQLDAQASTLLGHYAQVINLVGRKRYNGTTVFLEKWDSQRQLFEARMKDCY